MNFYKNVLSACKKRDITITELTKQLGISKGNISNWRKGILPKLVLRLKISKILGIPIQDILTPEEFADYKIVERSELMTNQIQVFNNTEFGNIRTLEINGEPFFVGKDVATALGYERPDNAIRNHVDGEDKLTHQISASGQNRTMYIINESGLYSLIFASKLPSAKRFKRWVTSEVLPMIRKTGKYSVPDTADEAEQPPVSLQERMEIAKLIAKTPKSRLHMVAKIFEPVLGVELLPNTLSTANTYGISSDDAILIVTEFIDSYDDSILREFEDGSMAINNKLFKEFLGKQKVNFYHLTKLLARSGAIRQDDKHISSVIHYQGRNIRALIINPDIVIKEN